MRTIKFRGQDYQGKWHYGSLITLTDDSGELNYFILEGNYELQTMEPFEDFILVKPETVGQFTGLYDKNGKEIYEGDIVEVLDTRMAVTYVNSSFRLRECTLACYDTKSIEVIGNVFDNPEMIKKEV